MEETRARAWQSEVRAWAATISATGPGSPHGGPAGRSVPRSAGRASCTRCHVGVPGGERTVLPDEAELAALGAGTDSLVGPAGGAGPGLRADLVERALDGVEDLGPAAVWVARTGPLGLGDVELAWHSAARHALARHGLDPDRFLVLSPNGWLHAGSGERREWGRLRPRPRAAPSTRPWDVAG